MNHWEFWIDVGGTFTDCIARTPERKLIPLKLLSSGVTKGQVSERTASHRFTDPNRQNDPPCFWVGYEMRLLDATGQPNHAGKVTEFDHLTGTVAVDQPLPEELAVGTNYELASGEESPIVAIRYLLGLRLWPSSARVLWQRLFSPKPQMAFSYR